LGKFILTIYTVLLSTVVVMEYHYSVIGHSVNMC